MVTKQKFATQEATRCSNGRLKNLDDVQIEQMGDGNDLWVGTLLAMVARKLRQLRNRTQLRVQDQLNVRSSDGGQ